MIDIDAEIRQEDAFINIIKTKISIVNPDVICVEKDVSFKLMEALFKDNRTVVANTPLKILNMVARCTQTIICPNSNFITRNFIVGSC